MNFPYLPLIAAKVYAGVLNGGEFPSGSVSVEISAERVACIHHEDIHIFVYMNMYS